MTAPARGVWLVAVMAVSLLWLECGVYQGATQQARREAAAERKARTEQPMPKELGGRNGPEPVRYGDWEKKGIAVDF